MFLSAFLVVLGGWWYNNNNYNYYYYYYLSEHNDIFENDEFQYSAEKGFVSLLFIPGK